MQSTSLSILTLNFHRPEYYCIFCVATLCNLTSYLIWHKIFTPSASQIRQVFLTNCTIWLSFSFLFLFQTGPRILNHSVLISHCQLASQNYSSIKENSWRKWSISEFPSVLRMWEGKTTKSEPRSPKGKIPPPDALVPGGGWGRRRRKTTVPLAAHPVCFWP